MGTKNRCQVERFASCIEGTILSVFAPKLPSQLIGDKAYDSYDLDQKIIENYGIEIISPHKENRKKKKTQDGRSLRRFSRRWKVERGFAWLQSFRRLVTRYAYKAENFSATVTGTGTATEISVFEMASKMISCTYLRKVGCM